MIQFYIKCLLLCCVTSSMLLAQPPRVNPQFLNQGHEWADSILSKMTLDQKIGQLFMVDAYSKPDNINRQAVLDQIENFHIGGVIFFAGHPNSQIELTNVYQKASKIPLMIAMDAEYGAAMRLDSLIRFPYNLSLGAVEDESLIYEMGKQMGNELRSLGVHINFAPVVDVNNNPNNPIISWRSFGDDPARVALLGNAITNGMQSVGVLATAKHFPGHGDTHIDSHLDLPELQFDRRRLDAVELPPFKSSIRNGVGGVMVAHMRIPAIDNTPNLPTTLSKNCIQDLLIDELGFKGLVFTDALNMKGVTKHFTQEEIGVMAIKAGNDVLLFPENMEKMINGLKAAIKNKTISEAEIDAKCRKILLAKYWFELSRATSLKPIESANVENELLTRQLTEKSITLLKNYDNIIPFQALDTLKVASISINATGNTIFQDRLDDYMPIDHFELQSKANSSSLDSIATLVENHNLIVVAIHDYQKFPWSKSNISDEVILWISNLADKKNVVIVDFRNPYLLKDLDKINTRALVTTYQDNQYTQDYAAQLLFGGIGAKGRLPVQISEELPFGTGIKTTGGIRFKYTIPEELGINGGELRSQIDSIMQLGIEAGAFPGGQVFLAKDGKVFYHESFGSHTYEQARLVQKDDIYDLASLTKITATLAGAMKLHDDGKFNLDAHFKDYYPYLKHSNKKNLLMRNALTHNAGFKAWIPFYQSFKKKNGKYKSRTVTYNQSENYPIFLSDSLYLHRKYRDRLFKLIKKSPVSDKNEYVYSDLPSYLFYEYIDRVSNNGFEEFLDVNFYKPLGAGTITYNAGKKFDLDKIVPTEKDTYFRGTLLHGVVHDEGAALLDGVSGHAGLFGNANDLAKVWQMYLNDGKYGTRQYITPQTVRLFTACQYCEMGNRRGIGFDKPDIIYDPIRSSTAKGASSDTFGHSGFTGTLVWADPQNNLLFVFLSNRVYPTRDRREIYNLNIRPAIHNVVYDLLPKEN